MRRSALLPALSIVIIVLARNVRTLDESCDLRPLGTKTEPLPADNRFAINIIGISNGLYIPTRVYRVRLYATDNSSSFIAYTIAAKEDEKENEKNPRKPFRLDTGKVTPTPNGVTRAACKNTVMQADVTPKTTVEVTWIAPPKENKCVTIYALVAVKPDVWYSLEGPLSQRVCEDKRKEEDMQPPLNNDCRVCEDARYQVADSCQSSQITGKKRNTNKRPYAKPEVTFEGTWSYNTHPTIFPLARETARFSELVGASHGDDYSMWKVSSEAGEGLKMLAEQGNTTKLELEIQANLGGNVRTVIKASGPPKPNMSTTASFRATRKHHRVSLVCGILPSPDWFLGVANFELCSMNDHQWSQRIVLNLYPMDAGTDSGGSFESPNEGTSPPQPISMAKINKDSPKEMRPFARLHFQLIRTYYKPAQACEVAATTADPSEPLDGNGEDENEQENVPPRTPPPATSEDPPQPDPGSPPDCAMTPWEDLGCEGDCVVDGVLEGYRTRVRYHMVDGLVVGKFTENGPSNIDKESEIPAQCRDIEDTVSEQCEDTCEAPSTEDPQPIAPGERWIGRRR